MTKACVTSREFENVNDKTKNILLSTKREDISSTKLAELIALLPVRNVTAIQNPSVN